VVLTVTLRLETERLVLRTFQIKDIESFRAYRSDPRVARYQSWQTPYSLELATQFVTEMHNQKPGLPGQWFQIALELKEDERMIGDYAFHLTEDSLQAEIAMTLAPAYQGKGYALEAGRCLLDHLFNQYPIHRIFANVDPRNAASIRLMGRLGLRFEGHFISSMWLKGEWVDENWYAILREEWETKQNTV